MAELRKKGLHVLPSILLEFDALIEKLGARGVKIKQHEIAGAALVLFFELDGVRQLELLAKAKTHDIETLRKAMLAEVEASAEDADVAVDEAEIEVGQAYPVSDPKPPRTQRKTKGDE